MIDADEFAKRASEDPSSPERNPGREYRQKWAWIRGMWMPIKPMIEYDNDGMACVEMEDEAQPRWHVPISWTAIGPRPEGPPPPPVR